MITDRLFDVDVDSNLLEVSLANDSHHVGTRPEFFQEPGTMTKVYEDENGPVLFVRGTPVLRLDIQYVDNENFERNKQAMLVGFPPLAAKARESGYREVVFTSSNRALRLFVRRHFGFREDKDEMRLFL